MKILTKIDSPNDLKTLSIDELTHLAADIRHLIISTMEKNGGHLASNLGSVELMIALHYVFNSPEDKLIFDTSHQTYPHKIITGRKHLFSTIRQFEGLSGFASPIESPHDHFYAGHAGTGLSLALGVAKSRDLLKKNEYIVPVLSDAPLACGLTLEALNHISPDLKKFILVLNDNKMAISNGVGNIHHHILGKNKAREFFTQFGFTYLDPINGHDLKSLIDVLEFGKKTNSPVVIHALTVKGQGVEEAVNNPITYHGVKPLNLTHKVSVTFPKVFGNYLVEMASKDEHLVVVSPAMLEGSSLDTFVEKFPNRCIDVGIAEGHAVTFAGGLAYYKTQKVVCSIYSTFFQRALDNLFQDVLLQQLPLVFALDRAGLSPSDGTTHHGIFDIGFLNALPKMVITQPRDGDLLKDLLFSAFKWNKTVAIRYPNLKTDESHRKPIFRPLGKGEIIKQGKEIAILALGHMCNMAQKVANLLLEHGIDATIIDPIFVKPIDSSLLFNLLLDHHYFVTIEEHSVASGFGAVINTFFAQSGFFDIQVQNFGLPDKFIEHGSYQELMNEVDLTPEKITTQILKRFSLKQPLRAYEKNRHLSKQL